MSDELINIHPNTPSVSGYRDLTRAEVDLINEIKAKGTEVSALIDTVRRHEGVDTDWLCEAVFDLKKGFMGLVRAVAQPTGF